MPPNSRTNCEQNSAPTPHTHNTRTHADTTTHPRHPHTNTDTSDSVLQTMQTQSETQHTTNVRSLQPSGVFKKSVVTETLHLRKTRQYPPSSKHYRDSENVSKTCKASGLKKKHQVLGEAT